MASASLCRLCQSASAANSMVAIFSPKAIETRLAQRMTLLLDVCVCSNDGLPGCICGKCSRRIEALERSVENLKRFKILAKETYTSLSSRTQRFARRFSLTSRQPHEHVASLVYMAYASCLFCFQWHMGAANALKCMQQWSVEISCSHSHLQFCDVEYSDCARKICGFHGIPWIPAHAYTVYTRPSPQLWEAGPGDKAS